MKKFFNVCAILLAICLAASFVSCKNNDDDDDDSSVVAGDSSVVAGDSSVVADNSSTVYTYSDGNVTQTLTFYDDNTVTSVSVNNGYTDSKTWTWTGSLSEGGTITMDGGTIAFSVSGNTMTIGGVEFTKQ